MILAETVSLSLLVSDFESSLAFYDGVMAELGCTRYDGESDIREAKYCRDNDEDLEVLSIIETPETTPIYSYQLL